MQPEGVTELTYWLVQGHFDVTLTFKGHFTKLVRVVGHGFAGWKQTVTLR